MINFVLHCSYSGSKQRKTVKKEERKNLIFTAPPHTKKQRGRTEKTQFRLSVFRKKICNTLFPHAPTQIKTDEDTKTMINFGLKGVMAFLMLSNLIPSSIHITKRSKYISWTE